MTQPIDDSDFASLLEREPLNDGLVHATREVRFMNDAGGYSLGTITVGSVQKTALDSAQERIHSLEGVLVAIRAQLARKMQREVELWDRINEYAAACGGITGTPTMSGRRMDAVAAVNRAVRMDPDAVIALISETLDPCKPWCALEQGHGGACISDERMDERE